MLKNGVRAEVDVGDGVCRRRQTADIAVKEILHGDAHRCVACLLFLPLVILSFSGLRVASSSIEKLLILRTRRQS